MTELPRGEFTGGVEYRIRGNTREDEQERVPYDHQAQRHEYTSSPWLRVECPIQGLIGLLIFASPRGKPHDET